MRVWYRPGATPLERLEAYLASCLCFRADFAPRLADFVIARMGWGSAREAAVRQLFRPGSIADPAEALGISRAVLLLCGVANERGSLLTGDPREDLERLLSGQYGCHDLSSTQACALRSLLEGYCYMGASFARGLDRAFRAVTGLSLTEHLHQAFTLLEAAV